MRDKYHRLSVFTTTKMETLDEPMKVIRWVDQVVKELPKVGRRVEDDEKHVVLPRGLEEGYMNEQRMPEKRDDWSTRRNTEVLTNR